ncbi:hypothetical protein LDG_8564 [Legionella drancourtii LLAP12]|uniref:Uncharacterized protein n=1 Tax=Legionella drancourtii LLAP12 TaxID=658187 RepID=G9ETD3_9GAMM|nr:hypothetical protein LDG_8564 [Legionella drancourtii LLAP12]
MAFGPSNLNSENQIYSKIILLLQNSTHIIDLGLVNMEDYQES